MIKKCLLCDKLFEIDNNIQKYCCVSHAYAYRAKIKYLKTKKRLSYISKDFMIWFTGFWEGEGCLISTNKWYNLTISQKDKGIMQLIQNTFRFGQAKKYSNSQSNHTWNLYSCGEILALIESIQPYIKLIHRKKQITKFKNSKRVKGFIKYVK